MHLLYLSMEEAEIIPFGLDQVSTCVRRLMLHLVISDFELILIRSIPVFTIGSL